MKPRAVLTKEQVIEIFRYSLAHSSSNNRPTASSVAKQFRVSEKTIRDIWKARTWHVETLQLDPNRRPREMKKAGRPLGRKDSMPRRTRFDKIDAPVRETASYSNCTGDMSDAKNRGNMHEEIFQAVDKCVGQEPLPTPFNSFGILPRGLYEYSESAHDPQKQRSNYALQDFQQDTLTDCSLELHRTDRSAIPTFLQLPQIQASLQLSPSGWFSNPIPDSFLPAELHIARPDLRLPLLMAPQPASLLMPLLSWDPSHPPAASISVGLAAAALLATHPTLLQAANAAASSANSAAQKPAAIACPAFPLRPPPPVFFAAPPPPPAACQLPPWLWRSQEAAN